VRRVGDHPTNPGPGVGEKGWQLGKTLGCWATVCMPAPPPKPVRRPLDLPGLGKTSHARQAFVISWVSVTLSVVAAAVGIWLSIVEGSLVDAESVSPV